MSTSPNPDRALPSAGRARAGRRALLAGAAVLATAIAPSSALAVSGKIQLTSAFAAPIAGNEAQCTPEPGGQRIYGTQAPFDSTKDADNPGGFGIGAPGEAGYVPANLHSRDSLTPVLQAGGVNDLCFGFTLTPNLEPTFQYSATNTEGSRLNNVPALPDIDQTHVVPATDGSPGPEGDDLRTAGIDLPTGFVGNPDAVAQCADAQFGLGNMLATPSAPKCPVNTQVGTVFARVSASFYTPGTGGNPGTNLNQHLVLGGLANPLTPTNNLIEGGGVYNLAHGPNELARLGVLIRPTAGIAPTKFVVRLVLNPDGTGRVHSVVDDAPRRVYRTSQIGSDGKPLPGVDSSPIYLEAIGIRAWGSKALHPTMAADFAEWGTDCSASLGATVNATTYAGTQSTASSAPFELTGCAALPFLPSVSVETAEKRPAVPTAATIKVQLGQTTTGPKTALLRNASVTLPEGLEIGAQVGSIDGGLKLCSAAQFGKDTPNVANSCPANSVAGNLTIVSPLQSLPFVGKVYLGEQSAVGELPALYLEATPTGATAADAPRIRLTGSVKVDDSGHLTTTFTDAPQLRFSSLQLDFKGGSNALFTTPRQCGTTTGTSQFTSWATTTPVSVESSLVIDQDCDLPALAPSIAMTSANSTVGASAATQVTITRNDRAPWLKDFNVALPTGFLADLKVASECSAGDAATGSCPDSSRIGTVTSVAGVGDAPLSLGGTMYLAERQEGSVAGAVIVVRAQIGDLDLGNVVVPARINLGASDSKLTLSTSAPVRFKGIALNLRSIQVNLDRQGFALNPTSCGPLHAQLDVTGDGGQTASAGTDVSYTGLRVTAVPAGHHRLTWRRHQAGCSPGRACDADPAPRRLEHEVDHGRAAGRGLLGSRKPPVVLYARGVQRRELSGVQPRRKRHGERVDHE